MNGVVDILQGGSSLLPVGGSSISALIGLVSGLFAGHSDSYILDIAFKNKEWDKATGVFFAWYQSIGFDGTKKPWFKVGTSQGVAPEVPQPYISMQRIEWLPTIWENTKNVDLANLINEAIKKGILDKKYFINSKNEMAAESTGLSNLFGGGASKNDGSDFGSKTTSLPYILLGGAALVAFLIFKKKK
jgi:hypothetical protein